MSSIRKKTGYENPYNIRFWQHVLEPLYAHFLLGSKNYKFSSSWNFGSELKIFRFRCYKKIWKFTKQKIEIKVIKQKFYETKVLNLSIEKSKRILSWKPILGIDKSLKFTLEWYLGYFKIKIYIS